MKKILKYGSYVFLYLTIYSISVIFFGVIIKILITALGLNISAENLSIIIVGLLAILVIHKYSKSNAEEIKIFKKSNFSEIISIIIFFSAFPIVYLILLRYLMNPSGVVEYEAPISTIDFIVSLIAIAVITPIHEELMFRKLCFNMLNQSNDMVKVLVSTIAFVLPHFVTSITVANFLVGALIITLIYYRTNNIFYSIVAHCSNNLVMQVIIKLNSEKVIPCYGDVPYFSHWFEIFSIILMLLSGGYLLYSFYIRESKYIKEKENAE